MRLLRAVVPAALLAVAACLAWAFAVEPGRLRVNEQKLTLDHWPVALDGLRVAAISDIHLGAPHVDARALDRVVRETNAARPDVIALLGDYGIRGVLGGRHVSPGVLSDHLRGLHAPLGVYAVLGNHDWWDDGPAIRRALGMAGVRVLENEATVVDVRGGRLWIAGLGDLMTRPVHVDATLAGVPRGAAVVLLSHNPDVFPDVRADVALTLAGHTHGGQVRLPFVGPPIVPSRFGQRYAAGVVVEDARTLFVTTGIGTSILPLRFGVTPEIAVLELRARASGNRAAFRRE